ncbi:hypothetical protein D6764_03080 [Candidatus Woesearchaeota archaeon]|nr:MAG: hypothetical protein D6764_03080 [Candidatus Woesearchaeota archaeon]
MGKGKEAIRGREKSRRKNARSVKRKETGNKSDAKRSPSGLPVRSRGKNKANTKKKPSVSGRKNTGKNIKKTSGRRAKTGKTTGKRNEVPVRSKEKERRKNLYELATVVASLTILLLFLVLAFALLPGAERKAPSRERVESYPPLKMYFISNPSSPRDNYIENTLIELEGRFRNRILLDLGYYPGKDNSEVITRLCIKKEEPEALAGYIYCSNRAGLYKDKCFNARVTKTAEVKNCIETERDRVIEENRRILEKIFGNETVQSGEPVLVIGSRRYHGGFSETEISRAVCSQLINPPPICGVIPSCFSDSDCYADPGKLAICESPGTPASRCVYVKAEPVEAVLLLEDNSQEPGYAAAKVLTVLDSEIKNLKVRTLALTSPEGRIIAERNAIDRTPAVLLPLNISSHPKFYRLKDAFEKRKDYYVLFP